MPTRHLRIVCCVVLLGLGILFAKDKGSWWDEPYTKWNQGQTAKMFNDSPWVQMQTYSYESTQGSLGQNETKFQFTVRLFSAQPVREAYVRMLQLMNNYDTLPPDRQQAFDAQEGGVAKADPGDEVVVAVAFACNDQRGSRDLKYFFDTVTTATLNQNAFLYSSSAGQIALAKYVPPQSGIGCRFIYPRTFQGKPILQAEDKELRFQVYVPPRGQELMVGFKPAKMVYHGNFCY
jgi:hypothetical protein